MHLPRLLPRPCLPLAAVLLALALHPAAARAQAAERSPCADSLYQALRGRPLNELSEREYEYFMQRERACADYQKLRGIVDRPKDAPPPRPVRLETSTSTRDNGAGGVDVLVRNESDQPVIVNSVRVYDCENVRTTSCGLHFPKTKIPPGQERRVTTIRFVSTGLPTRYRYEYNITAVEPK